MTCDYLKGNSVFFILDRLKVWALSIRLGILPKDKRKKKVDERIKKEVIEDLRPDTIISEAEAAHSRSSNKRVKNPPLNPFRKRLRLDQSFLPRVKLEEEHERSFHKCSPEYEDGDVNLSEDLQLTDITDDVCEKNTNYVIKSSEDLVIKLSASRDCSNDKKKPASLNRKNKHHKKEARHVSYSSGKTKIKCEFCNKGMLKTSIKRHERNVHLKKNSCPECKKKFVFKASQIAHECNGDGD